MHIRIPFLAVLLISIFQLTIYGLQNNEYSKKELDEILTVSFDDVTEISMTDLAGNERRTTNPEQIKTFLQYLDQFKYKRLMNDETTYMPMQTMSIYLYADEDIEFIIPYGKEALITHKVYSVKDGTIEQADLLELFNSLPDD